MALSSTRFQKAINLAPLPRIEDWQWDPALNGGLGGVKVVASPPGSSVVARVDPFQNILGWGNLERTAGQRDGFISPATKTSVVRLFADWFEIQPQNRDSFYGKCLPALDEQIWAANNAGLKVILCTRGYPPWTNNAGWDIAGNWIPVRPDLRRDRDNPTEIAADRAQWKSDYFSTMTQSDFDAGPGARFDTARLQQRQAGYRPLRFRLPGDITAPNDRALAKYRAGTGGGPDGDWYRWIEFLAERYHPGGTRKTISTAPNNAHGAKIDVLEIVNEPNGPEGWPMHGTSVKTKMAPRIVAEMMISGDQLLRAANGRAERAGKPRLQFAGPAVSDHKAGTEGTRGSQRADAFVTEMIKSFPANFPNNKNFLFSCHNYKDTEWERSKRPTGSWQSGKVNMAAWMVRFLRTGPGKAARGRKPAWTGWTGWPSASRSTACLILTEGGCRIGIASNRKGKPPITESMQSAFLDRGLRRMRDQSPGNGVRLFTQFLTWEAPPSGDPNNPTFPSDIVRRTIGTTDISQFSSSPTPAQFQSAQRLAFGRWAAFTEKSKTD